MSNVHRRLDVPLAPADSAVEADGFNVLGGALDDMFARFAAAEAAELARERARAAALHGTDAPEVKVLAARAASAGAVSAAFRDDADRGSITGPKVADGMSVVHGRVLRDGRGADELVVSAIAESGKALDYATTDRRGYFAVTFASSREPVPMRLVVTDEKRTVLHRDPQPTSVSAGVVDYREIDLDPTKRHVPPIR